MKKLYTLIAVALLGVSYSNAQVNIQDYNGGSPTGSNLNGTVIAITAASGDQVVVDLGITNTSGADKFYKIERLRIVEVPAWTSSEQICWGYGVEGSCYATSGSSSSWISPDWSSPLPDGAVANLKFDIHTTSVDYLHYRFYIEEGHTIIDSVDVIINQTLGLQNNVKKENVAISVYPNPTSNYITVSTGNDSDYSVKITDVLGKVVYNESYSGKIDVSSYKNGVYLVAIYDKGQMIQTRRVVVKH